MDKNPLALVMEAMAPGKNISEARTIVGDACGVTRQAVEHWEDDGIPGKHVLTLESACNGAVSARDLLEWSARKRGSKAAA